MAENFLPLPEKPFSSANEEIAFLRQELAKKEQIGESSVEKSNIAKEAIRAYQDLPSDKVMPPERSISPEATEAIVLKLAPEAHDHKMGELLGIMQEKGVKNALSIVQKMNSPHLEDDFHRFLIEYLKEGFSVTGLKPKTMMWRSLHLTLFEISLPEAGEGEQNKTLKEQISRMEQLYAGLLSISTSEDSKEKNYFTLEIANANQSDEFIFYASVPNDKIDLFEKQLLAIFPEAKVSEKKDDYNIFNEEGVSLTAVADLSKESALPLKTYENFDFDPINVLLNAFSKISKTGEGSSIQILLRSSSDFYLKRYKSVLTKLQEGEKLKDALRGPKSVLSHVGDFFSPNTSPSKKSSDGPKTLDQTSIEAVTAKLGSPTVETVIRLAVSAGTTERAKEILSHLESAFNQLENTHGNKIKFIEAKGRHAREELTNFVFRNFDEKAIMPLNLKELTTILHFPTSSGKGTPQLKQVRAVGAPAPLNLPTDGILLGVNRYRGVENKIIMSEDDRLRHFYTIGQTGTGKSTLLKNMIVQDIEQGHGVCMIDPHGVDVIDVLGSVPEHRLNDVIYFDPAYTERPMALNMLEFDPKYPEQKTFVVNELLGIFNKLFDMKTAGGPMFEQYFRNAVLLTMEDAESGNTLVDVSRVLADKTFREKKLMRCKNPIVVEFWHGVADKAGGEAALANIVPYITSKFDGFLSNDIMRPVIAQEKSSFNFREVMDSKKILLVNLSKGRLGDLNAHLIGLILVGKILMAALSRADSLGQNLPPFYLYIDEFQNVTTDSIATILSEARKYKLSLNMAHQFIDQLDDKIKSAVFGNVGSLAVFRVGADDAEYLEKQFEPTFTAKDIMNLDNRMAYLKLLVNGLTAKPFDISTLAPAKPTVENIERIKQLSYQKFGRPRAEVEAEVMGKYKKA